MNCGMDADREAIADWQICHEVIEASDIEEYEPMPAPYVKRCTHCNQPGQFYKNRRMPDGLDNYCTECRNAYTKRWRKARADRYLKHRRLLAQYYRERKRRETQAQGAAA